jgi:Na+-transporting NADH:ubiquinone oxidoreductase subunit F
MADIKTCTVDINDGRIALECRQGMTLFAALRMNKIHLPTGCGARGLCGQCKVKLIRGDADLLTDSEMKLIPEEERLGGARLGCQLRLSGDLAVRVPEYVFDAKPHPAVIDSITNLTHDIKRFGLALEPGDSIPHRAGQFINLVAKIPGGNTQIVRCFSFATPASVRDRIDIIVRLNPKGVMTPYLFTQARLGEQLSVIAPFGEFVLRDGDLPCIWIAGGSGLSPFLGMLQDMIDKGVDNRRVHLFFGAVKPNDLYYVDLFNNMSNQHPWFTFTPALSGEEHTDACRDYGLITDVVARHVGDASGCEGYLCGSPGMIGACLKVLSEKGVRRDRIFYDRF